MTSSKQQKKLKEEYPEFREYMRLKSRYYYYRKRDDGANMCDKIINEMSKIPKIWVKSNREKWEKALKEKYGDGDYLEKIKKSNVIV